MLMSREAICQDKFVDQFTDAILLHDQPRTADLFFRMVRRESRSVGDALSVVTAAEAPFVQVPNHIDVRDGQITLINNDHTILGLRTSAARNEIFLRPSFEVRSRAMASMASVRSTPTTSPAAAAKACAMYPGPQATSSTRSWPHKPAALTSR